MNRLLIALCMAALVVAAPKEAAAQAKPLIGHSEDVQKNSHGLGFALDPNGGLLGFAYRKYFGNTALQLDLLPLLQDHGQSKSIYAGLQVINYAVVWPGGRGAGMPTTTALRLTAGTAFNINSTNEQVSVPDPNCQSTVCKQITQEQSPSTWKYKLAGGFGFEFGAVQRSGFSVAVDLMMTVLWDQEGFYGAYPLPYLTLMYSF